MKNTVKRVLSLVLMLVIVFSLATVCYAAQPVAVEKKGFFGWLAGLLGGESDPEPTAVPAKEADDAPKAEPAGEPGFAPKAAGEPETDRRQSVDTQIETMDHCIRDDQGQILVECYYDLVTITGEGKVVEAINARLREGYKNYADGLDALAEDIENDPWLSPEAPYVDSVTAEVTYNDNGIISISFWTDWMMGGVRNWDPSSVTFDLTSGQPMALEDILRQPEDVLEKKMKDITLEYMYEGDYIELEQAEGLLDEYTLADLSFYIAQDGEVILTYPTYALTIGAEGALVIPTGLFAK